jgi:hypothetical protein
MMKGKMMTETKTTERRIAKLTFEEGKYVARYNGRLLAKSFSKEYVVEKIRGRDCSRAMELGVYDVEEESHMTTEGVNPEILEEEDAIEFDINTRFEFLESCNDDEGHGIYVDPPWPDDGAKYRHKFSEDDHGKLRDSLEKYARARVVVRYGDHPLIRKLYSGPKWVWREVSGRTQTNADKAEVLILNGPSQAGANGTLF